jgi:pyrimidine operon attenuation protein/uracil phosphoribosyltransferase
MSSSSPATAPAATNSSTNPSSQDGMQLGALQLDAEAMYLTLLKAVRAWAATAPDGFRLVGITSGGAWLAQRLQADLGLPGAAGVISSAMHRDDFASRGLASTAQTSLPFEVNGTHVLLVDDVLYTGRTIRAVLNELFDYGRPASVTLAVLVDRGGRELPVEAALAAARLSLPASQKLALARREDGQLSLLVGQAQRPA